MTAPAVEFASALEQEVVGAVLARPAILTEIDLLPAEFSSPRWRDAWAVIQAMMARHEQIDLLTVTDALIRDTGRQDWLAHLGQAAQECVTPSQAPRTAERIRDMARERQATEVARELLENIRQHGLAAVDDAMRRLAAIGAPRQRFECGILEATRGALELMQEALDASGMPGVTTGLDDLDKVLGGFHPGDLYVVGGRPAMGKTAFGLNLAVSAALAGTPCGIISAEQPREQIAMRMMAIRGNLPLAKMRTADLTEDEWRSVQTASVSLTNIAPIRINDQPAISIAEVQRQGRLWRQQYGIGFLLVDYLQRLRASEAGRNASTAERVGEVVMGLKELARELNIPVIALAQVNREVERRTDKRPGMADMKDSGIIEQEADCVMTLYRDEVYNPDTPEKGRLEINIEKNRHGPTGGVLAVWRASALRVLPIVRDRDAEVFE